MSATVKNLGGSATLTGDAKPGDVVAGKYFYSNDAGNKQTGTMPNNGTHGDATAIINTSWGTFVRFPYGSYRADNSVEYPNTSYVALTESQIGAANASDVKSGVKFTSSKGANISGTFAGQEKTVNSSTTKQTVTPDSGKYLSKVTVNAMANKGAITGTVGVGGTYSSTQNGYVTTIKVTGPTLSGTATAPYVYDGKTFYKDNGTKLTGTMAVQGTKTYTIDPGETQTIPQGYHSGKGSVTATAAAAALTKKVWDEKDMTSYTSYTHTTTAAYTSCLIIACSMVQLTNEDMVISTSAGSVTKIEAGRFKNSGDAGFCAGIAIYKGTNITKGAKITVKTASNHVQWGMGLYILA